jgi:anaerobic selenocysteine-containing dehydrogenase
VLGNGAYTKQACRYHHSANCNLLLLKGNIGKPGAGLCPVRGHSNVQGDRTMGIVENPSALFLDALENVFDFVAPRQLGYNTVDAIRAMNAHKVKVFIGMGGNFVSATPDTSFTEDAIKKCELTAYISTKLNRSHLVTGHQAFILPCLGRTEIDLQNKIPQKVTVEDSMSMVHTSEGINKPASEHLLSNLLLSRAWPLPLYQYKNRLGRTGERL